MKLEKNCIHSNICIADITQIQLYENTKCRSKNTLEEFLTSKTFFPLFGGIILRRWVFWNLIGCKGALTSVQILTCVNLKYFPLTQAVISNL